RQRVRPWRVLGHDRRRHRRALVVATRSDPRRHRAPVRTSDEPVVETHHARARSMRWLTHTLAGLLVLGTLAVALAGGALWLVATEASTLCACATLLART